MNYLLTQQLGDKIVSYLVTKPYNEVSVLIDELKSLNKVNVLQDTVDKSQTEDAKPVSETDENTSEESKG